MFVVNEKVESNSTITLNIIENHKLLYYKIPKEVIEILELNEKDMLEYDVRGDSFYSRKKGLVIRPDNADSNVFEGLRVERNITRNNTTLRTNLPKEVAQPLQISRGDIIELTLDGKVIIGKKINKNR